MMLRISWALVPWVVALYVLLVADVVYYAASLRWLVVLLAINIPMACIFTLLNRIPLHNSALKSSHVGFFHVRQRKDFLQIQHCIGDVNSGVQKRRHVHM